MEVVLVVIFVPGRKGCYTTTLLIILHDPQVRILGVLRVCLLKLKTPVMQQLKMAIVSSCGFGLIGKINLVGRLPINRV